MINWIGARQTGHNCLNWHHATYLSRILDACLQATHTHTHEELAIILISFTISFDIRKDYRG